MTVLIADLREHIETDAVDDVLTRILYAAVSDVETRFGNDAERTLYRQGLGRSVALLRPVASVSAVKEYDKNHNLSYTLTTADYKLLFGGRILQRIGGDWAAWVEITCTPKTEAEIRDMAVVELCRLELTYQGLITSESVGDYKAGLAEYTEARERILNQISNHRGFRFV